MYVQRLSILPVEFSINSSFVGYGEQIQRKELFPNKTRLITYGAQTD
jgi:hypothetical protein